MPKVLFPTLLALLLSVASGAVLADNVARAQFTSGIADREPVDRLEQIDADSAQVTFFTELRDLQGRTVTHRWVHGGETLAEVSFDVGGPRWRVWSSKTLLPDWQGEWSVEVVDEDGSLLGSWDIVYGGQPAM